MDLHIGDFCQDVARILNELYTVFPLPHSLYVEDISGPDEPDEVGLHSRRFSSSFGAMLWLAEEGYLRYQSLIYQEGIEHSVLTRKAFLKLSAKSELLYVDAPPQPASVKQEMQTRIEQIRAALRSGDSNKINAVVHYFLSAEVDTIFPETNQPESDHAADTEYGID